MKTTYARSVADDQVFSAAREQMETMIAELRSPETLATPHNEVEAMLLEQGRELERRLFQAHLDLRAALERPVAVRGHDGVERSYRRLSHRPLQSVVGGVVVRRLAYQAKGVDSRHPIDGSLNLAPDLFSFGVRRLVAEHAAIMSFDDVVAELTAHTGAWVGKRQVEELAVRAAIDFEAFYADGRAANDVIEHTLDPLLMTFDGKGVVTVPEGLRPATRAAARKAVRKLATRLAGGEKRNRKRMAEVAAIYTVLRNLARRGGQPCTGRLLVPQFRQAAVPAAPARAGDGA